MSTKTYAKTDSSVECYRCGGLGVIPWGDAPDESDPCDECEGYGEWLEKVDMKENDDERVA